MNIRLENKNDAAALIAIYAPYVEKTAITFEYDVPSVEEFSGRIEKTLKGILICWRRKRESFWVMLMLRLIMVERHTTGLLSCRSM